MWNSVLQVLDTEKQMVTMKDWIRFTAWLSLMYRDDWRLIYTTKLKCQIKRLNAIFLLLKDLKQKKNRHVLLNLEA